MLQTTFITSDRRTKIQAHGYYNNYVVSCFVRQNYRGYIITKLEEIFGSRVVQEKVQSEFFLIKKYSKTQTQMVQPFFELTHNSNFY